MTVEQQQYKYDRDFEIGNLPEGLNVTASEGAPVYLNTSSLELKQDIGQFGLAGKIWQRCVCVSFFDIDSYIELF